MKTVPARKFIADLGRKAEPKPEDNPAWAEPLQLHAVQDKNSPEQRIAAARAQAFEEGRASATEEFKAVFERERELYEKQLALERLAWVNREADQLSEQLTAGLSELETRIADTVSELLKPFLVGAVRRRVIDDLLRAIDTLVTSENGVTLEISGPEDLQQVLREKLEGKNIRLAFISGGGPELRIVAGQTVLETQLAGWMTKVEEVLR